MHISDKETMTVFRLEYGRQSGCSSELSSSPTDQPSQSNNEEEEEDSNLSSSPKQSDQQTSKEEDALLRLAAEQRMNTDVRRAIFCIIMGSADINDAFEKLVRGEFFQKKKDRDIVRLLVDCVGREKHYNPFYAHLLQRVTNYQPKCKFTLQLTFYDVFKQMDEKMDVRKAANTAKLLSQLVKFGVLTLNVFKGMDALKEDVHDMPESCCAFFSVFCVQLFEKMEDSKEVKKLFETGIPRTVDGDALRESLSLFMMQYIESNPKNVNKSSFKNNYKVALKACEVSTLDLL